MCCDSPNSEYLCQIMTPALLSDKSMNNLYYDKSWLHLIVAAK